MSTLVALAVLAVTSPVATPVPQPTSAGSYELLTGEDLAGSGFLIRCQGQLWAIASIHQFDGATPSRFLQLVGEPSEILLQPEQVRRQRDVQAIRVQDQDLPLPFLRHEPVFTLETGARLMVLGPAGERVPARLDASGSYSSEGGAERLSLRTERPFVAGGGSGAPILSQSTGAVVGVLVAADDPEEARRVEFETLTFCHGDAAAAEPRFTDVAGRWTVDTTYVERLWREEQGEAYDEAEWQRIKDDPDWIPADEMRLDERSISFYKAGSQNVGYPVLGWSTDGEIVWVRARHFLGSELRFGLVVRDDHLKILREDGTWRWGSAFRRAAPTSRRPGHGASFLRIVIMGMVMMGVLLLLLLGVLLLILKARAARRRGGAVPGQQHEASREQT